MRMYYNASNHNSGKDMFWVSYVYSLSSSPCMVTRESSLYLLSAPAESKVHVWMEQLSPNFGSSWIFDPLIIKLVLVFYVPIFETDLRGSRDESEKGWIDFRKFLIFFSSSYSFFAATSRYWQASKFACRFTCNLMHLWSWLMKLFREI